MNFRAHASAMLLILLSTNAGHAAYCPDGTTVAGTTCKLAPDGRYVSGDGPIQIAPDGHYTSGQPQITPNGDYVGGHGMMQMCPDGSYVRGRCHMNPDGTYRGE